jgi:hypothetical protein
MNFYFQLGGKIRFFERPDEPAESAGNLVAVTVERPAAPETPPSPYLMTNVTEPLKLVDVSEPYGRIELARFISDIPLYRITLELLVDHILLESRSDPVRMKGVRQAFAPDDPPEPIGDTMAEKYAFAGVLHFPVIASRTDAQLIDLYLRLFGPACPEHTDPQSHLAAMLGGYPARLADAFDGIIWRGTGWVRLDRIVYDAERLDYDPNITLESYVPRGRSAAEALHINDPESLLAAWLSAERVQRELARDIDAVLRLSDIRRLPRWVRSDVFRLLEREAMKQVFAEGIVRHLSDWPSLRRTRILAEPIEANAKGEVAPLLQQLMNQTLSADSRYSGAAEAFALAAERRYAEAKKLLGV